VVITNLSIKIKKRIDVTKSDIASQVVHSESAEKEKIFSS